MVSRIQIFLGLRRNEKKIKLRPLSWLQKRYQNEHRECLLLNLYLLPHLVPMKISANFY